MLVSASCYAADLPATIHIDDSVLVPGPAGATGVQGPAGPTGTPGVQGPVGPQGASGATSIPTVWNSGTNSELTTIIPVTTGGCGTITNCNISPKQIFKVNIGPVQEGDVIVSMSEAEFTNDLSYVVSVVSGLTISNDTNFGTTDDSLFFTGTKYQISEWNGPNIDRTVVHHSVHSKTGLIVITPGIKAALGDGDCFIMLNAWSVSSAATSGATVSVDKPYGRLVVLRWR